MEQSHRPLRGATRDNLVRARERTRNSFVRGAGGLGEIIEAILAWDMRALASSHVSRSGLLMGAMGACVFRGGRPQWCAVGSAPAPLPPPSPPHAPQCRGHVPVLVLLTKLVTCTSVVGGGAISKSVIDVYWNLL